MTLFKTKTTLTVEAIQLTDISTLVGWLYANYAGHWSIESDHDPATIFLKVDTTSGSSHAAPGSWAIAEGALPAVYLSFLDNPTFVATYDPV